LRAGVVLSRPPQLTRDLTSFEKAFFLYQKRLNERLALPFTQYFYYRKGTPSLIDWKKKIAERKTPARDIGRYNPYLEDGWHDEVLIGAQEGEPEHMMDALLKDVEVPVVNKFQTEEAKLEEANKDLIQRPMPRVTEADNSGDQKSLNRLLSRTLYLLVKGKEGQWQFPTDALMGRESFQLVCNAPSTMRLDN
jgi:large subunit ribosomal protein L46